MTEKEFSVENVRIQMRKGILEFPILLIIANKEAYASDILLELKKADLLVVEGTLYPILSRLRRSELLEYTWKESKNGPPRKYYSLTHKGRTVLDELISTWNILTNSIQTLLKQYEKSN